MKKNIFTDEWMEKELLKLEEEETKASSKFIIQILVSYLNFISKKEITTLEDYERVKKELIGDESLVDVDEVKAEVWRNEPQVYK